MQEQIWIYHYLKKASLHVVMQDDNKKYLFEQAKDYFIAVGSTTDVILIKKKMYHKTT